MDGSEFWSCFWASIVLFLCFLDAWIITTIRFLASKSNMSDLVAKCFLCTCQIPIINEEMNFKVTQLIMSCAHAIKSWMVRRFWSFRTYLNTVFILWSQKWECLVLWGKFLLLTSYYKILRSWTNCIVCCICEKYLEKRV